MIVACVLRSGGEYDVEDVIRLEAGIRTHLLGARFICFSDIPMRCVTVRLEHAWPGWWSKLEIFRPEIEGDLLYADLDTIITGDLSDMAGIGKLTIMRDVYRPDGLQSSVMYIPQSEKRRVWEAFRSRPDIHMRRHSGGGDQAFLETLWLGGAAIWQDELPGQVVSYKAGKIAENGVPADCRAVVFHGRPKPRDIGWTL